MRLRFPQWVVAGALASAIGCGASDDARPNDRTERVHSSSPVQTSQQPRSEAPDARPRVVVLGDSLTAGLGLPREAAFPTLLQERLDAAGLNLQVVNAGVSGDTSAGGLRRLDWALEGDVRILVVALGANDGLRGIPAEELQRNLSEIIERAKARNVLVILAGMEAPPNFGSAYTASFRAVYPALARQHDLPLIPFLLDGVAGIEALNQRDGIHPTAEGARKIADTVWKALEPAARRAVTPAPRPPHRAETP
jgi:acyl-CoA thioesterase-1